MGKLSLGPRLGMATQCLDVNFVVVVVYFDFIMRLGGVKSARGAMLPVISMRLSDVGENKKLCFFQLPHRLIA